MKRKFLITAAAALLAAIFILTGCVKTEPPQAAESFEQDLAGTIPMEVITLPVNATGNKNEVTTAGAVCVLQLIGGIRRLPRLCGVSDSAKQRRRPVGSGLL